ncbi:thiol-disulfide oxidoreductase DCC family protein [Niallia alba]|uniref:Thiol-disulfide oxidoreductase DCC family protein n=1 Tax=Niallia circulans TaxID=1397 RepID=A0A941JQ84_NIACI|nr:MULTISPECIES: thiol-disulfide oxidoreductase DCC family protein [Niallia]MCB5239973.1 thiol-disulfide oxidoreductase DCC family protein [Niallia circulans]MDU1846714.1 thiol-disulfide oxidoreductase DCC family protein [Niallia nealsonii]MED3793293.1 thiol-disulfide oxidoreductase DCC family protein [Niallia alba]
MIVLFDGVCNLCSKSVQFIIKRDPHNQFFFASLQSEMGKSLLEKHHLSEVDSVVLIKDDMYYIESDAALEICRHLSSGWKLLAILKGIPSFIRDPLYRFVARNRYRWFGKQDSCMLPTEEMKKRFL